MRRPADQNEAFGREELSFLEQVPASLFHATVTCGLGALQERVPAVLAWRAALLAGRLPGAETTWPPEPLGGALRETLFELSMPRYTAEAPVVVDAVVADLLAAADELVLAPDDGQGARDRFIEAWQGKVATWRRVEQVLGPLGRLLGTDHDLGAGVLRDAGLLEAQRLALLIERVPWFTKLVETLGQVQAGPSSAAVARVFDGLSRPDEERRRLRTPLVASDARGIERSDSAARMLPSEASLLVHPVLRRLWHAKRAERTLLSYLIEGTAWDPTPPRPMPKAVRGPLILALDTSASMRGIPERVAKALALEAARTAHRENRRCLVLAFGSRDEVIEHELSLGVKGVGALMSFLGLTFGGGTEMGGPLERIAARLEAGGMSSADVALVTDGIFDLPAAPVRRLKHALAKNGGRCHGVLVGREKSPTLSAIATVVHVFPSWEAIEGE